MEIYIQRNGQVEGPLSKRQYQERFDQGFLRPDDLVSVDKTTWYPLSLALEPAPVARKTRTESTPVAPVLPVEPVPITTTPPASPINPLPVEQMPRSKKRLCKRCGAPYSLWSPFHAMGSGLCTACSKATAQPSQPPIHQRPIESREDALRVIKYTAVLYLFIVVLDFALGFAPMGVIILVCIISLWAYHSRAGAILLMVCAVLGIVALFVNGYASNYATIRIGMMLEVFQILLTCKAIEATFKLHSKSVNSFGGAGVPTIASAKASGLSHTAYWCIATPVILAALVVMAFQDQRTGKADTQVKELPEFYPEPSPTTWRTTPTPPPKPPNVGLLKTQSTFDAVYGNSYGTFDADSSQRLDTTTVFYTHQGLVYMIQFWHGIAHNVFINRQDGGSMTEEDIQVGLTAYSDDEKWRPAECTNRLCIKQWERNGAVAEWMRHDQSGDKVGPLNAADVLEVASPEFWQEIHKSD